jgi:hypothetical protein
MEALVTKISSQAGLTPAQAEQATGIGLGLLKAHGNRATARPQFVENLAGSIPGLSGYV